VEGFRSVRATHYNRGAMNRATPGFVALSLVCGLAAGAPGRAAVAPVEPTSIALSAGIFDTAGDEAAEAGLELRWANRLPWGLGVILGVSGNEDEAVWGHLGLRLPFALGATRWRLQPSFAVVAYDKGESKELGQTLEFRSALELHYAFANHQSLGLLFYHLSNASLSDVNPGSNSLVLVWAVPIGR